MSKELVVASLPHETRLAVLEDDRLVEICVERESQQGLAGSIYKGRVTRVLPGMQSAFVDVGLERDAFLYVTDFFEGAEEFDENGAKTKTVDEPVAASKERAGGLPESPRGRDEDRRQRRGRRGRRRGPGARRGSGFPESKYASLHPSEPEEKAEPGIEAADEPALASREGADFERTGPDHGFTVLPGESLAKYRDQPGPTEDNSLDVESEESFEAVPRGVLGAEREESESEKPLEEDASELRQRTVSSDEAGPTEKPPLGVSAGGTKEPGSTHAAKTSRSKSALADEEPAVRPEAEDADEEEANDALDEAVEEIEAWVDSLARKNSEEDANEAAEARAETASGPADSSADDSEDEIREDRDADGEVGSEPRETREGEERSAPGEPRRQIEAVRLRSRSGSSRYSNRRGRRGRRRFGRAEKRPEGTKDRIPEAAAEASAETNGEQDERTKITSLLSKGMEILVQISKEPVGRKGARITSHIALPGRYLVYMPTVDHVGVSRKIVSDAERHRLRGIIRTHRTGMPGGFIARTAVEGASEEDIRGDMLFLYNLWLDIREKAEKRSSTGLIHQDLDVVERVLRDQLDEEFKTIWVDAEEEYERILRFVERFQPKLLPRVKLYTRPKPIFDEFNITAEIEKALRPKVWLKSGGYIVINQTEALVAIDVNTGKYVGKSDRLEDTIVNTNIEATKEIVRQMRLRDLGGIIVIDFIDMEDRPNRQKVLQALEQELRRDSAPSKALPFNDFGLVSITRRRMRQSLERTLCAPCPYCNGAGSVKSVQTVVHEILEDARKITPTTERQKDVTLRVNPEVARFLKSRDNTYLQEIEEVLHGHVLVRGDQSLHREHFDIN